MKLPMLMISGAHDAVSPPADGRFIVDHIPGAQYAELNAAHLSNIEAPEAFTAALTKFLAQQETK